MDVWIERQFTRSMQTSDVTRFFADSAWRDFLERVDHGSGRNFCCGEDNTNMPGNQL
jgi:hypothetical protein